MSRSAIVVTGGTRGIGAAIARELAASGHGLVLGYRSNADAATALQAELRAGGAGCEIVQADVTREADIERLFAVAVERFGRVGGLVNNAGATMHIGPLADTAAETVRAVIDVNLTAAVLCAREAVRVMSTRFGGDGGVIVNISSGAATLGSPGEYVHYAAAKAGLDALTLGLAKEVGPEGIRVVGVAPGTIRTDIHADAGDAGRPDRVASRVPLGRAGEVEDVAPLVAWLFGPGAGFITGTTIRVAGGA
ncbi:SDR family NAD(P)-dependent oxidoreductase [Microterricola viridarii]|uniref:Glucose 1-dehydrogenase n=1 Tax=Microterricola viridarii TaxID=412690 RepID=A0A1H1Q8P0_9MICO|nr:SDR family oxidoreductase [Microterricola viridarii]SDS19806.1 glucose 1-dehydrogenase [Microterricola viridarii]